MKIAIFPGSFRPPHRGHYEIAKLAAKVSGVDQVRVIISAPKKSAPRGGISAETSLEIWRHYLLADPDPDASKIQPEISSNPGPIGATFDLIADNTVFQSGDVASLVAGEEEDMASRGYSRAQGHADKHNPGVEVEILSLPMQSRGDLKGEIVRGFIETGDKVGFASKLPDHLSDRPEIVDEIWNLIKSQISESALRHMIKFLITT